MMEAITTLEQLHAAALAGRSVVCFNRRMGPVPAALAENWSGTYLVHQFRAGMFLHDKKGKPADGEPIEKGGE